MQTDWRYFSEIYYPFFDKWFVSYYLNPHNLKSKFSFSDLGSLISPVKEKIKKNDYDGSLKVVKKVSFADGKIHLRDENETGMDLYKLLLNQLLVSKINFHQGAVAVNKLEDVVCSTHYQPYKINGEKVNSDYLIMVLRSKPFLDFIAFLRADGIKNEATFEFIKKLKIPVPPLETQQILLDNYTQKLTQAEANLQEADRLEKEIEGYLLEELGIEFDEKPKEKVKGFFFVEYQEVERWNVDFLKNISSTANIKKGKYPTSKVRNLLTYLQYGLSLKASTEPKGFPLIRMNNIVRGQLVINDLKYLDVPTKEVESTLLQKGDILFNRTNSKELVGKTAVFDIEGDYTFASYCIRLRFDTTKVNIEYVNYLFNSKIGRSQIDQVSRQVLGQANINSQELQEFIFPIPPLAIQEQIVEHIQAMKSSIKTLKEEAISLKANALSDFESEIFE